jgi:hypothetical protein
MAVGPNYVRALFEHSLIFDGRSARLKGLSRKSQCARRTSSGDERTAADISRSFNHAGLLSPVPSNSCGPHTALTRVVCLSPKKE